MIEKYYISDKWFDGSWWEAELPEECQLSESSAQHIRVVINDAHILIGLRKSARIIEGSARDQWAKNNLSPSEGWAYSNIKSEKGGEYLAPIDTIYSIFGFDWNA